jgi:hypothetical protein
MFRLTALVLIVALAGCHRETRSDDQRTASGQVLQGSVSDAMIAYEQLQSRPPLAPRVVENAKGTPAATSAAGDEADVAPDAPAEDAAPANPIRY